VGDGVGVTTVALMDVLFDDILVWDTVGEIVGDAVGIATGDDVVALELLAELDVEFALALLCTIGCWLRLSASSGFAGLSRIQF